MMYTVDGLGTSGSIFYPAGNSTNFKWYQRDGLSQAMHTLNISVAEALNHATFIFDYLLYTPSISPNQGQPPGPIQQASSSIQQPSSSISQLLTGTTDPQVSTIPQPNHPGISHGALIGAIVGPVLSVTLVVLMLLFMCRRKLLWSSGQRFETG
ncbi:hypothetical protein C0993_007149 [Termitomyces sp. T159_Od127]|nr:hypothetical protein C0993_007149 [Termitomyces sp. T159_Od127]